MKTIDFYQPLVFIYCFTYLGTQQYVVSVMNIPVWVDQEKCKKKGKLLSIKVF